MVDASMVKWTTLDPYKGLSESDSKLYIKFEFYFEESQTLTLHIYSIYKPM